MRKRISVLVVLLIAAMLTTVGGVSAQGGTDSTELGRVIRGFMNAEVSGDTVMVNDPGPAKSPFGDDSKLPADVTAPITIVGTMDFAFNPFAFNGFVPDGVDVVVGQPSEPGMVVLETLDLPFPQMWPPPFGPAADGHVETLIEELTGLPIPQGFGGDFSGGRPTAFGDFTIVPPAGGGSPDFSQPLVLRAFRTAAPFPHGSCNSNVIEMFTGDAINGDPIWEPREFAPNDMFGGISQAHVVRCMNGELQPLELLRNDGSGFPPVDTDAFALMGPQGGAFFIPIGEVSGSSVWRTGAFTMPSGVSPTPDNTGFTTAPPYPGLAPTMQEFFVNNPFPGHALHPVGLDFAEADDGSPAWQGNFVQAFDEQAEAPSPEEFDVHMWQVDSYQLSRGPFVFMPADSTYEGQLSSSGDGYAEKYDFTASTYEYEAGSSMPVYPMAVESGTDAGLISQMGSVHDDRVEAASAPPPTEPPTSSSTTPASSTDSTTPEVIDEAAGEGETTEGGGSSPILWILILVVLAFIAAFGWWFFFGKPKDDPCKEKFDAWQKAKAACDEAAKTAKQKRTDADKAKTNREDAEKARKEHCRAYPPACGPQSSATDVDSGRTVTRDDLHVQRQWTRSAWAGYGAGTQSAAETEAQWKSPPSEQFRTDALAKLKAAKAKTPELDKAIDDTKTAEADANTAADQADKDAKKACDDAAAAKSAYDECVKKRDGAEAAADSAAASAAGAAVGGVGGAVAAGAGAGAQAGGGKDCSAEQQAYDTAKKACDDATDAADAADGALDDAEEALEDLCEEYPPLCHDGDWAEESGKPDTRVTSRDLFVRDVWAEHVWSDYETGDISAQEASDRWGQDPTGDFARDQLRKLEDAKSLHKAREQAVKDASTKADKSRVAADEACTKADAAKRAFDACKAAAGG